jgi:4-amino-4-deoxy-L-arabinose transferase-like glycosyltransferase
MGVAVALLVVAAVGLRVVFVDSLGVNSDEAVYAGQAASIAGNVDLLPYFPIFRAHPLLFQVILSIPYGLWGVSSLAGRLLSAAFGVATVAMVYVTGKRMYGRTAGYISALVAATMPYLVVVNRQIILDGPMVFMATVGLYFMARFALSHRSAWLYAASVALGLTFLAKETSILLLGGIYAFIALTPSLRIRPRELVTATLIYLAVILVYPVSVMLSGASRTGGNFVVWQLLRRANHDWTFYPTVVPPALGIPVIIAAVLGLWFLRGRRSWRESLLIWWIVGPVVFFEIWAVKGFQYLLPIAPAVAILAGQSLAALGTRRWGTRGWSIDGRVVMTILVAFTTIWLAVSSVTSILPNRAGTEFLAGTGGVPGGREAGLWVNENVPEGAELLALGPSMANIIQFYGHRKTYGLSTSPNPLHRNPVYEPVLNPDLRIRHNDLQYIVWDSFSAGRSPFFAAGLLKYVDRYNGEMVHTENITFVTDGGGSVTKPAIVIYRVRP